MIDTIYDGYMCPRCGQHLDDSEQVKALRAQVAQLEAEVGSMHNNLVSRDKQVATLTAMVHELTVVSGAKLEELDPVLVKAWVEL